MTAVWELTLPDSEKLALLALADCANDEGLCWPSMATLARKCSKSDRTLQKAIMSLSEKGHLSRDERPGKGVLYRIHPRSDVTPEAASPPKSETNTPEAASDNPKRNINSPLPPGSATPGLGDGDTSDEYWRIPAGRSWKEATGMLRELNRKPKRQPQRGRTSAQSQQSTPNPISRKCVLARQREDQRSHELRSSLKRVLGQSVFDHWFDTAAVLVNTSDVTVIAASQFQSEWMEQNFARHIFSAARNFFGDGNPKLRFQTGPCDHAGAGQ